MRLIDDDAVSQSEVDQLRAKRPGGAGRAGRRRRRGSARARSMSSSRRCARRSAGRISDRRVDAGNLVAGGDGAAATLLTTINALDPIYFSFDGSEALFLKTKRDRQAGHAPSPVEIQLQDEGGYRWNGKLDFTDNGLDPRSGTIRGRAVLANPGLCS